MNLTRTVVAVLILAAASTASAQPLQPLTARAIASISDLAPIVEMSRPTAAPPRRSPWWATALAVAGPLADGFSTRWAIAQSGPVAQVVEGNAFYRHLFGSNVTSNEILAFKVGQAALLGLATHYAPEDRRGQAIFNAFVNAGIHAYVARQNIVNGRAARRLNIVASVAW